jgi:RIO kinase 1
MADSLLHLSLLEAFFEEGFITDVLSIVKSGKEATVYCCQANRPSTGMKLLAAKVYRSLQTRSFKNDAIYQAGRAIRDQRLQRAFNKKTRKGREVQFTSWIEHEFQTLNLLHAIGADVPQPVACSGNAILMEYMGNEQQPAPILNNVSLEPTEVEFLFHQLISNVELMLAWDKIHGDLSAFNILYWEGSVKIIDFPQSVDPRLNPNAFFLLTKDIENLCQYFGQYGVQANSFQIAEDLWNRFLCAEL